MFAVPAGRILKAVIRMVCQNMIRNRPMKVIEFNAHSDFVAVLFIATTFLVVNQIASMNCKVKLSRYWRFTIFLINTSPSRASVSAATR